MLKGELISPYLDDHCNTDYWDLTKGNKEKFEKIAREWPKKYAQ